MIKTFYFKKNKTNFYPKIILIAFSVLLLIYASINLKRIDLLLMSFFIIFFGILQFYKKGVEFNLSSNQYRQFYSVFNIKIGDWITFKDPVYITFFNSVKTKHTFYIKAPSIKIKTFEVVIFMKDNTNISVYFNENELDAKDEANKIADFLKINRLNNIDNQNIWVTKF